MWEMNIWHDGMFGWGDPVLMEIWTDPIPQPSVINTTIQAFRQIEREREGDNCWIFWHTWKGRKGCAIVHSYSYNWLVNTKIGILRFTHSPSHVTFQLWVHLDIKRGIGVWQRFPWDVAMHWQIACLVLIIFGAWQNWTKTNWRNVQDEDKMSVILQHAVLDVWRCVCRLTMVVGLCCVSCWWGRGTPACRPWQAPPPLPRSLITIIRISNWSATDEYSQHQDEDEAGHLPRAQGEVGWEAEEESTRLSSTDSISSPSCATWT